MVTSFKIGAAVRWNPRVQITNREVSSLGTSGGLGSCSKDSLTPRFRLDRPLGVWSSAAPFLRVEARESRSASSETSSDASREATDGPRLCEEMELSARFCRVAEGFSVLIIGAVLSVPVTWLRRDFLSRGGDTSIPPGDGARSLIGLTSSGRGRGGDEGESGILKRGVLFHGVEEPGVSIESRGREARDSEKDGMTTLGVCEIWGRPIGTGVWTAEGTGIGVLGIVDGGNVNGCFVCETSGT